MKPFPDFMRYMVPVAPLFLLLTVVMVKRAVSMRPLFAWILIPALIFGVGFAARASFYVYYFNKDTRRQLVLLLGKHSIPRKQVKGEVFTFTDVTMPSITQLNLEEDRKKRIRYLVPATSGMTRFL